VLECAPLNETWVPDPGVHTQWPDLGDPAEPAVDASAVHADHQAQVHGGPVGVCTEGQDMVTMAISVVRSQYNIAH